MNRTTFTLAEAAALLKCHPETLRRAIHDGSLQAAKLGKSYRLSRVDLQTFWTSMGGGVLFAPDADQPAQPEPAAPVSKQDKKKAKADPDIMQLSLFAPKGENND